MCAGLAHDLLRACGPVSHDGLSASPAVALGVEVWSKVVGGMLGGILEEVAVALVSAPPPPARCALFCFALLNRNSCRALHHCAARFLPLYCLVSPLHCIASYLRHRTMYCLLSPTSYDVLPPISDIVRCLASYLRAPRHTKHTHGMHETASTPPHLSFVLCCFVFCL